MNTCPTPTITVLLHGQPYPLPAGTALAELVAQLGHAPHAASTAVNGLFVARARAPPLRRPAPSFGRDAPARAPIAAALQPCRRR